MSKFSIAHLFASNHPAKRDARGIDFDLYAAGGILKLLYSDIPRDTGRRGVKLDCKYGQFLLYKYNRSCRSEITNVGNIRDLTTRNAILFHSGDDPFTPGGLGVSFRYPNEARTHYLV